MQMYRLKSIFDKHGYLLYTFSLVICLYSLIHINFKLAVFQRIVINAFMNFADEIDLTLIDENTDDFILHKINRRITSYGSVIIKFYQVPKTGIRHFKITFRIQR